MRLTDRALLQANPAAQGYAVALAESAKAAGNLEAVHGDCETFSAYAAASAGVLTVLENPVLADSKKKDLIAKMAKEGNFSPLFVSFMGLLVDKKRTGLTTQILAEFEAIYCGLTDTQARCARSCHASDGGGGLRGRAANRAANRAAVGNPRLAAFLICALPPPLTRRRALSRWPPLCPL